MLQQCLSLMWSSTCNTPVAAPSRLPQKARSTVAARLSEPEGADETTLTAASGLALPAYVAIFSTPLPERRRSRILVGWHPLSAEQPIYAQLQLHTRAESMRTWTIRQHHLPALSCLRLTGGSIVPYYCNI